MDEQDSGDIQAGAASYGSFRFRKKEIYGMGVGQVQASLCKWSDSETVIRGMEEFYTTIC